MDMPRFRLLGQQTNIPLLSIVGFQEPLLKTVPLYTSFLKIKVAN